MKLTITESFLYNDFELLLAAEDEDGNPYISQYMGETPESIKYALIPRQQGITGAVRQGGDGPQNPPAGKMRGRMVPN